MQKRMDAVHRALQQKRAEHFQVFLETIKLQNEHRGIRDEVAKLKAQMDSADRARSSNDATADAQCLVARVLGIKAECEGAQAALTWLQNFSEELDGHRKALRLERNELEDRHSDLQHQCKALVMTCPRRFIDLVRWTHTRPSSSSST